VAAGFVVVASAGNHGMDDAGQAGYAGITSPGNAPSALTAGALRTKATATRLDDEVAAFSSRGPTWYDGLSKPDVLAPGQALVAINASDTTLYENAALRADITPYLRLSGTSMAAGVTSGVVALLIEANRLDEGASSVLTPNLIKAILQFTAIAVADPDPTTPAMLEQGAGAINAAGAIALTRAIDPDMPKGSSWLEAGIEPFTLLDGLPLPWVQHIVWGDHLVWGDTIAWNLDAWDEHIVWGDGDEHLVWGDIGEYLFWSGDEHIVWGDAFFQSESGVLESFSVWSGHIVWGDFIDVLWQDEHIVWGDLVANLED
jgi:serine protease AprX